MEILLKTTKNSLYPNLNRRRFPSVDKQAKSKLRVRVTSLPPNPQVNCLTHR
jgi:hypothetical protein